MRAIILAGGFGTRLNKKVPNIPKPMAPIAGRPFLEYILDRLVDTQISQVTISVGYKAKIIMNYFKNSYKNLIIDYIHEDHPLGTGGAITYALENINDDHTLVINGDTLVNINYFNLIDWYLKNPTKVAVVVKKLSDVSRYGTVKIQNEKILRFLEKGQNGEGWMNAGVYMLKTNLFENYELPYRFAFEKDFLQKHTLSLIPSAYKTSCYFIDIGIPEDYERAQIELPSLD